MRPSLGPLPVDDKVLEDLVLWHCLQEHAVLRWFRACPLGFAIDLDQADITLSRSARYSKGQSGIEITIDPLEHIEDAKAFFDGNLILFNPVLRHPPNADGDYLFHCLRSPFSQQLTSHPSANQPHLRHCRSLILPGASFARMVESH